MEPQQQQQQHTLAATSPASLTTTPQHASTTATTATAAAAAAAANTTITITTTTTVPALASTATAISATTNAATAFSGSSVAHQNIQQTQHHHPPTHVQQQHNSSSTSSSLLGGISGTSSSAGGAGQQTIEKLSRPAAFDKMEALVREMQDPENGVPVRQQKMFLTSIPYAFMGYDLIEWLMDRLLIEESEALNIANQLCLHGYFFPVNDTKTLVVKDDSSLYRFQTPYYWPWQHKAPDNVEYAIYLAKRSLRNKQRHALEDYEVEALASLHKNLKGKWDFISMQAEEQVRLAKERKKGDKIVGDSQERAYWRVHRPPPGQFTPLEPCPVPSRDRQGAKPNKKKTIEDAQREVDYLRKTINRTRMKMSQACESLVNYSETFVEYDFFLQPALPSNPWVTEDTTFWQLNNTYVDIPTEKRVKRWAISIDELVSDPTGLQEFTNFLEKEYSHENIRFWIEVNRLRRSAHSQVTPKVNEIFEEFLKPGAPCEINIDGKTMESVVKGLNNPSRFTFDSASDHIYMLLLKKDCYPRFIRSDHYKRLLETGIQPSHKKRFFNFGGVSGAKKKMTAALSSQPNMGEATSAKVGAVGGIVSTMMQAPPPGSLARRRGSDRSLTGSAHELAVIGVNKDSTNKVPHSHSQSNLSEMPYSESVYRGDLPTRMVAMDAGVYAAFGTRDKRLQAIQDAPKPKIATRLETTIESACSAVCPWDLPDEPTTTTSKQLAPIPGASQVQLSICPWEQDSGETSPALITAKSASQRLTSTSSDISEVSDRLQRSSLGIRHQNTVDSGEAGMKRLMPNFTEQRRASVSFTPGRISDYQMGRPSMSKTASTPSPTVGSQIAVDSAFPPLYTPLAQSTCSINKDTSTTTPASTEEPEVAEIFKKLSLTDGAHLPQQRSPSSSTPECISTAAEPQQTGGGDSAEEEIQDVQIELIETSTFVDPGKCSLRRSLECVTINSQDVLSRATTPTINVEECAALVQSSSNSNTPSPKSPKLVVVVDDSSLTGLETFRDVPPTRAEQLPREPSVIIPPPLPLVGPMEEEQLLDDDGSVAQEELSPTTDEYQEGLQFGADSKDVYDYDIVDTDTQSGYIAPAPTPAPSMAPLAEIDMDTVEDETLEETLCKSPIPPESEPEPETMPSVVTIALPVASADEVKKRHKKRSSESKRMASLEEKEKDNASTSAADDGTRTDAERNTVCPWEDENVSPSDGTFVKTYATLGYL